MRIATYNVNNLFERAKLFELEGFSEKTRVVLEDIQELNKLLKYPYYEPVNNKIKYLLEKYFLHPRNNYFVINQVKGQLFSVNTDNCGITLLAKGRKDWKGWAELIKSPVDNIAFQNTGRVINEVKPDLMCMVEVESREALENFNKNSLNNHFKYNMAFDGNDKRGIELGLYSNYAITNFKSHMFETFQMDGNQHKVFNRDCAEYEITLTDNKKLYILCNHFKSKGCGSEQENDIKRKKQAEKVNEILGKYNLKKDYVIVSGDFNDTPDSEALQPLLSNNRLINIVDNIDGSKGTYLDKDEQIDYLMVSMPLYGKITNIGIERRGIFDNGQISHFDTVTNKSNQASDHALVWADFSIDRCN
jgi:endonuclease/exonuclease/phosphatase family metal-dependent hydrolase